MNYMKSNAPAGFSVNNSLRILLVGEASGVHWTLKEALESIGHSCDHVVFQDPGGSWAGRKWDFSLSRGGSGVLSKVEQNILPLLKVARFEQYDVINFLNTITSQNGRFAKYKDLPVLRRKAKAISYYAVGCDELGLIRLHGDTLPYTPCESCLNSSDQLGQDCKNWLFEHHEKGEALARRYFDCGFSSMVEYDHSKRAFDADLFWRVPFPVNVDKIEFHPATPDPITRIVHTPTRQGFKGTSVVLEAIRLLVQTRTDFEFSIVEGLAYEEYLRVIAGADVVIDQVYSQSPGMNGLEMLAMGKIVLTGATPLGRVYHGFMDQLPAFDAAPEPQQLAATLSEVLDRKKEFPSLAQQGRRFVQEHYRPVDIARRFVEGWSTVLSRKGVLVE